MAEGDEEKSQGDEQKEQREKEKQKWKEEDERSAQLLADIQALLKRVQERRKRQESGDAGADT
jgi:TATA-binding protein-associated factor Taf7